MSQTDPGSRGPSAPTDECQRCHAVAVSTSERCQHDALPGINYCAQHIHLTDGLFTA